VAPAVISAVRRDKASRLYLAELEIHRRGVRSSAGSTPSATAMRKRESSVGFACSHSISLIRVLRLSARSAKSAWVIRSESLNSRTFRPSAARRRLWTLAKDSDFVTSPPGIPRFPTERLSDGKDCTLNLPRLGRTAYRASFEIKDSSFGPATECQLGFTIDDRAWTGFGTLSPVGGQVRASRPVRGPANSSRKPIAVERLAFPTESFDQDGATGEG
jgi:hypothetical protein